jgi:hypothetical protein
MHLISVGLTLRSKLPGNNPITAEHEIAICP